MMVLAVGCFFLAAAVANFLWSKFSPLRATSRRLFARSKSEAVFAAGMERRWSLKTFEQLSCLELYDLLRLREAVFHLEQGCIYTDLDGLDISCHHLLCMEGSSVVAYARLLPDGAYKKDYVSIGRVVVAPSARSTGLGRQLVSTALQRLDDLYPGQSVAISAQYHLRSWYTSMGFECVGEPYQDAGIPHITMVLSRLSTAPTH